MPKGYAAVVDGYAKKTVSVYQAKPDAQIAVADALFRADSNGEIVLPDELGEQLGFKRLRMHAEVMAIAVVNGDVEPVRWPYLADPEPAPAAQTAAEGQQDAETASAAEPGAETAADPAPATDPAPEPEAAQTAAGASPGDAGTETPSTGAIDAAATAGEPEPAATDVAPAAAPAVAGKSSTPRSTEKSSQVRSRGR